MYITTQYFHKIVSDVWLTCTIKQSLAAPYTFRKITHLLHTIKCT